MKVTYSRIRPLIAVCVAVASPFAVANIDIAQAPLFVSNAAPPLNMLVMGRDHKLYYEAYNDASDLNGDGVIDVGYKGYLAPSEGGIDYYGYFDSRRCYTYDGTTRQFNPAQAAPDKTCDGTTWSGDFLNYLTTSRMDALRKVFYGGYRAVDSTSETVLERAHIPQEAHSWGKEYTSKKVDGYDIAKYTSLTTPTSGTRHLFANTTLSWDAGGEAWGPRLRVLQHSKYRIWEWVSIERPVAGGICGISRQDCGTIKDYRVRVRVCEKDKLEAGCQLYPNATYKPTGILHDYGANERMYFGLLTGSYKKNTEGGVLRSNIKSFASELNEQTGQFCLDGNCGTDGNVKGIVDTINRLKTSGFGGEIYDCGWVLDGPIQDGQCEMWGNPVAEMMYEALRYYAGAKKPHPNFDYDNGWGSDSDLGLPKPAWAPPYTPKTDGGSGHYACSLPVMTVVSDINPSYDSSLPGSKWSPLAVDEKLDGLNVSTEVDAIWGAETNKPQSIFIGESAGVADNAPTPKAFNNFSTIRGLAPEEPTKQGTYYSAGLARFAANRKIGGDKALRTYAVALASPLPTFEIPVGNNRITLVPFAKTVGNENFQPTNQIVDFYVQKIANMAEDGSDRDSSINKGRPYAEFRINFEDVEQGADHDMDMIVLYTVAVTPNGRLNISLHSEYAAGGSLQHAGYVISGSKTDGVYLEVCDLDDNTANNGTRNSCDGQTAYKLNTPPGRPAGWCAIDTNLKSAECTGLPPTAERSFEPGDTRGAKLLENPLWYAAKYGTPASTNWDSDKNGVPDNYFLVTNAVTLKEQLNKAFSDILQKNTSVSTPAVMPEGPSVNDDRSVYSTSFKAEDWSGELIKRTLKPTTETLTLAWQAQIPANRTIKMAGEKGLVDFQWSNLSKRQQAMLNRTATGAVDDKGSERLDYLRGDRSQEGKTFRERKSLLGDIVNSGPVVVANAQYLSYLADAIEGDKSGYGEFKRAQSNRRPQIYVGANDGMLHAFDGETGTETFAFIPSAVFEHLNQLTATDYQHRYYVDGSLVVRDVFFKGDWHTVLIGTLRAGGRSLFALDVTDPDNIKLLWEFSDDNPDTLDKDTQLSDLGYSFPIPAVARLHSGEWAVLMGNGYNSANSGSGKAVLFILDIETGKLISKLEAQGTAEKSNGLSSVRAVDFNGDNVADYAYAGDLQGNLWRFDLFDKSSNASTPFSRSGDGPGVANQFAVSFSGKPLYSAIENGKAQPITALPILVRHPSEIGYLVIFGTGRYVGEADKANVDVQSIYGIWDNQTQGETTTGTRSLARGDLQQQTFERQTSASFEQAQQDIRLLSQNPVTWFDENGNVTKWGWYLDLKVGEKASLGERVIDEIMIRGQVLFVGTRTPSNDPCTPGLKGWTYGIDPHTGGRTDFNVFDLSGNNSVDMSDSFQEAVVSGFETTAGGFDITGSDLFTPVGVDGGKGGGEDPRPDVPTPPYDVDTGPNSTGRQSWQVVPQEQE